MSETPQAVRIVRHAERNAILEALRTTAAFMYFSLRVAVVRFLRDHGRPFRGACPVDP
jgi:hypothetical protein